MENRHFSVRKDNQLQLYSIFGLTNVTANQIIMKKNTQIISALLLILIAFDSFADTEKPVIENKNADKTDSCWVINLQLQSIFADVTTATDDSSSLGNGLTLIASPLSPQGGAAVDTRFQGTTTVTYTATDPSGNVATQCIKYVVKDNSNQSKIGFQGEEDSAIIHVNSEWYSRMRYIDSMNNDLSLSLLMVTNLNTSIVGDYWVRYVLVDSKGDQKEKTITLLIRDLINPLVKGKNGGVVRIKPNDTFDPSDHISISDNYDSPSTLKQNLVLLFNDVNSREYGLYATVFQVTDSSGNKSDPFTLYTDVTDKAGIVDENGIRTRIFPNPVEKTLFIEFAESDKDLKINVLDALGRVVTVQLQETSNGYHIDVQNLNAGLYFIEVRKGNAMQREKFVVR